MRVESIDPIDERRVESSRVDRARIAVCPVGVVGHTRIPRCVRSMIGRGAMRVDIGGGLASMGATWVRIRDDVDDAREWTLQPREGLAPCPRARGREATDDDDERTNEGRWGR